MKIISHRGNLVGANPKLENDPSQIEHVLKTTRFDVEIDVWKLGTELFLGHDEPQYKVPPMFFARGWGDYRRLWLHCKNLAAFESFQFNDAMHVFWHQNDDYTLTTTGFIWVYPGKRYLKNCYLVHLDKNFTDTENVSGICTDYPLAYGS